MSRKTGKEQKIENVIRETEEAIRRIKSDCDLTEFGKAIHIEAQKRVALSECHRIATETDMSKFEYGGRIR